MFRVQPDYLAIVFHGLAVSSRAPVAVIVRLPGRFLQKSFNLLSAQAGPRKLTWSRGDLLFSSGDRLTAKLLGSCQFCGRIRLGHSDFTHFDVAELRQVIPEAFDLVEKDFATEQDFREFTFSNAAHLHRRNMRIASRAKEIGATVIAFLR